MSLTLRIWALSLIIQPICFGPLGLFVIPIELVGSIPGIILFGLMVQLLSKANLSFATSYALLLIIAGILGFLSSYLFLNGDNGIVENNDEKLLFSLPALIAASLAVALSYKKAKKFFEPRHEERRDEGYYEY